MAVSRPFGEKLVVCSHDAPRWQRRAASRPRLFPMYRQPDGYAQPSGGGPSSSAEPCVCIDVPPDANPHLDRRRRSGSQK